MRRVVMQCAITLDGFIAGPNEEFDWCRGDPGVMTAFFRTVDTVLIGRRTYDLMVRMGEPSYRGLRNVVFTKSPPAVSGKTEFVTGNAAAFVRALREEKGKDIWLSGGAALFQSLLAAGVVDDISLAVHPLLLGGGIPLFASDAGRVPLTLTSAQPLKHGLVMLNYIVSAGPQ